MPTKTGKIPGNTNLTYASNSKLDDGVLNNYTSLNGNRIFYEPGIGLDLSVPDPIKPKRFYSNVVSEISKNKTIYQDVVGNKMKLAYFGFDNTNILENTLPGFSKTTVDIAQCRATVANPTVFEQFVYSGEGKFFVIPEDGNYKLTIKSDLITLVTMYRPDSKAPAANYNVCVFLRTNNTETPLTQSLYSTTAPFSDKSGTKTARMEVSFLHQNTVFLTAGTTLALYGKIFMRTDPNERDIDDLRVSARNQSFTIEKVVSDNSDGETNSGFGNSDSEEWQRKTTKYFGLNRDTLNLDGNILK